MEHYAPAQQVFAAGLVFARMAAIVMLIPGFGETFVPIRIRLSLALTLAFVLVPVIGGAVPPIPAAVSGVAFAVIKETAIGLMIGTILRIFLSSLAAAGEVVSIQTTLGFAQTANPTQAAPSTTVATFLGLMGLVLIMVTNLHHLFLTAIVHSYVLFPFTRDLPLADANTLAVQTFSRSFSLGLQLAAPVVAFSLALALLLSPVVGGAVPALPATVSGVAGAVIKETAIGLMIGAILRFFLTSLAAAGEIVSIQSTLGFAQTANPTQAAPSTAIGAFLGLMGLVLIMTTNLHHLFISAIVRSYASFPFHKAVPVRDAGALAIQTVGRSFSLGVQLAAPVMAFAFIFNIATGLVGRVMPQFQVFFVASPLMVLTSLSIFALSLGAVGMVWVDHYRELIGVFG